MVTYSSLEEFNVLATKHTLYYNLWELCDRLGVKLEANDKYHNKPVRQGDRSIIDVAIEKGYRDKTLESINVVRKYLNLIHLSDLVHCDGKILSEDLLEASARVTTNVTFPKEKPTRNDKSLWVQFLDTLTDGRNTLLEPLREYISLPHAKLHRQSFNLGHFHPETKRHTYIHTYNTTKQAQIFSVPTLITPSTMCMSSEQMREE